MQSDKYNTKYRPQSFDEFFGHKEIITKLNSYNFLNSTTSIIFHSTVPGVGKTSLARVVAKKYIENEEDFFILNDSIIEIDAGQNNTVDHYRNLIDNFKYQTYSGKRVIIIDESHLISSSAGASLLKIVEEPPEGHLFIFCTTNIKKMLPTLISRSVVFELKPFLSEDIYEYLSILKNKEKLNLEDNTLKEISLKANGSIRTAINLLFGNLQEDTNIDFIALINNLKANKKQYLSKIINTYNTISFYEQSISQLNESLKKYLEFDQDVILVFFKKIQKILLQNFILAQQLPQQFIKQSINLTLLEILEVINGN